MKKISKNLLQLAYAKYFINVLLGSITILVLVLIFIYNRNRSFLDPKNIQSDISCYNKSLATFITIDLGFELESSRSTCGYARSRT